MATKVTIALSKEVACNNLRQRAEKSSFFLLLPNACNPVFTEYELRANIVYMCFFLINLTSDPHFLKIEV